MKITIFFILLLVFCYTTNAQVTITEVSTFPERVSNNAVCEGFIDNTPYIFSFGGIDSSKVYSGIHLKSFRYNTQTGTTIQIPDLPDSSQQLLALAVALGTLVDSKSQSKKVRDDMVAVVNAIDELLESEINARDELYLETRAEMLTKYQDSVLPQMERVLERVGQLHPQLKTTLKQRLLSKIGD